MQTHRAHFVVRDGYDHTGVQERADSHYKCNIKRCASQTRIHTRERREEGKCDQQRTRDGKGPERNVHAVAPASHIVTTECQVTNTCVHQSRTQIETGVYKDRIDVVAEPFVPNVIFALGRENPQIHRYPAQPHHTEQ